MTSREHVKLHDVTILGIVSCRKLTATDVRTGKTIWIHAECGKVSERLELLKEKLKEFGH